jgi:hypothetical protein
MGHDLEAPDGRGSDGGDLIMADMVTVCCRMPHGLELRISPPGDAERRAKMSANKTPDLSPVAYVDRVVIKGANRAPDYHLKDNRLLGRVGRTQVDKSFWDAWLAQNKDGPLVQNSCVFAEATDARAEAKSREFRNVKTGFEPIEPDDLKKKGLEVA